MGALLEYGSLQLKDPVNIKEGSQSTRTAGYDDDANLKNLREETLSSDHQDSHALKMDEGRDEKRECKDKQGGQDRAIDLTVDTPYVTASASSSSSTAFVENLAISSSMGSNARQSRIGTSASKRKRKNQEMEREDADERSGEEEYNEEGLETEVEDKQDRKSTRLNSSHALTSRMPSSA